MREINDWKISIFYRNGLVFITSGADKYCGLEVELNLPLDLKQAERLIDTIVEVCREHKQALSEQKKFNAFKRPVRFKKMNSLLDTDKTIWRIVFADNNGRFPDDELCNDAYKNQCSIDNGISNEDFYNTYELSLYPYEA